MASAGPSWLPPIHTTLFLFDIWRSFDSTFHCDPHSFLKSRLSNRSPLMTSSSAGISSSCTILRNSLNSLALQTALPKCMSLIMSDIPMPYVRSKSGFNPCPKIINI